MKRIFFVLTIAIGYVICSWGYDFEVDGVYYNVVDLSQLTAQVTAPPSNTSYRGDITVPRHVTYNGRTFTIERVEPRAFNRSALVSLFVEDSVEMNVLPTDCNRLISLRMPGTITSLSGECNCPNLQDFEIPSSVETIAASTFRKSSLKSIQLPASVKHVGGMLGGTQTTELTVDENNPYIKTRDGWIFSIDGDTLLSSLSSNVIDGYIVLPDEVEYVADEIFIGITIRELHLPQALKVMSKMFSSYCKTEKYLELTLPSKVECINEEALNGIGISKLVVPASVKRMMNLPLGTGYDADKTNENRSREFPLRTLIFEDSSEPLIVQCFSYHPSAIDQNLHLESLYLGRSLQLFNNEYLWGTSTTTADCVFSYQNKLRSLTVGKNCDNETLMLLFGQSGEVLTSALDTIVMNRINPPMVDVTFSNVQYMNLQLSVPRQSLEKYQQANPWKNFWNITPLDDVASVPGDLSGDCIVDVSDVDKMIDMVLGKVEQDITVADLNGDGIVDVTDVDLLIDIILGKVPSGDEEPFTQTYTANGVSFKMVEINGGTFQMGGTAEQQWVNDNEKPVHQVTVSDFCLGQTEVTQELWKAVMGYNPSKFRAANGYEEDLQRPVEMVTREDALTFISRLNELTGESFRLPTEAEWEYAARGGNKSCGTMYAGGNDPDPVAWCSINSGKITHAVGTKLSNELGLYDMSGNVYEWCSDFFGDYSSTTQVNPTGPTSGDKVVVRGASWYHAIKDCRVSARLAIDPARCYDSIGIRLVK